MNDMNLENLKKTFVYFIKTKNKFKRNANMEQTSLPSTLYCRPKQFIPTNNSNIRILVQNEAQFRNMIFISLFKVIVFNAVGNLSYRYMRHQYNDRETQRSISKRSFTRSGGGLIGISSQKNKLVILHLI
jgi:hypothetical protein